MRAIADEACEVARHYGARSFYAGPEGLVGVRKRGMYVWHRWEMAAGGYVVSGSTVKRGWNVTQHRCESGEPVPVRAYRKRPRGR
jgi:hypothetical protein